MITFTGNLLALLGAEVQFEVDLFVYFSLSKRLSKGAFVNLADVQGCSSCFSVVAPSNKLFCHL